MRMHTPCLLFCLSHTRTHKHTIHTQLRILNLLHSPLCFIFVLHFFSFCVTFSFALSLPTFPSLPPSLPPPLSFFLSVSRYFPRFLPLYRSLSLSIACSPSRLLARTHALSLFLFRALLRFLSSLDWAGLEANDSWIFNHYAQALKRASDMGRDSERKSNRASESERERARESKREQARDSKRETASERQQARESKRESKREAAGMRQQVRVSQQASKGERQQERASERRRAQVRERAQGRKKREGAQMSV